ncbi:MAG: hypothetical protein V4613_01465 [Bacteroidota bacterium]
MLNHKKSVLLLLVFSFAIFSYAQNNTHSPYSARGFGELEPFNTAYNKSLGGVSNGIRSSRFISLSNPASLGGLSLVTFDFGFKGESGVSSTTNAKQSYFNGNFNYIVLGFPIWQKEILKDTGVKKGSSSGKNNLIKVYKTLWCSSIGLTPYSNLGSSYYKLTDTTYGQIANFYSKTGGLSRLFVMNAVNVTKNVSLGLNASYVFGQLRNNQAFFVQDSGVSRALYDESIHHLKGFSFDFGFQSNHRDTLVVEKTEINDKNEIIRKIKRIPLRFVFGATLTNQSQLNYTLSRLAVNKNNYYTFGTIDTLVNENNVRGKTYLPQAFSAGFSFTYNNLWLVAFDYSGAMWGSVKQTLFTDKFSNRSQMSIGIAYRPDLDPIINKSITGKKFGKPNLEYRFGFRTLNTGYNFKDNTGVISPLKEYGISFGIGIPKTRQMLYPRQYIKSMVNLTAEYIHRGTTKNGMVEEHLLSLTIGITLGDVWFTKRKFN